MLICRFKIKIQHQGYESAASFSDILNLFIHLFYHPSLKFHRNGSTSPFISSAHVFSHLVPCRSSQGVSPLYVLLPVGSLGGNTVNKMTQTSVEIRNTIHSQDFPWEKHNPFLKGKESQIKHTQTLIQHELLSETCLESFNLRHVRQSWRDTVYRVRVWFSFFLLKNSPGMTFLAHWCPKQTYLPRMICT